jgi:hypothetical protein
MPIFSSILVFHERLLANERKIAEMKENEAYYAGLSQTTRNILTSMDGYWWNLEAIGKYTGYSRYQVPAFFSRKR